MIAFFLFFNSIIFSFNCWFVIIKLFLQGYTTFDNAKIEIKLLSLKKDCAMNIDYSKNRSSKEIETLTATLVSKSLENCTKEVWKRCIECCDATSLSVCDTAQQIETFTKSLMLKTPNVASICISPIHIEDVGIALGSSPISITSTVGGFPLSQTFIEVKMLEVAMALENGADELDFVINVGAIHEKQYDVAKSEIETIVQEVDSEAVLKVIIESGSLKDFTSIRNAAYVAMEAGADFVKTSTGKNDMGATPQAVVVIALAIKDFYDATGVKKGIKISGGVKTPQQASLYYTIVKEILSEQWLTPSLFRIGASSLVDALYESIEQ